MTRTDGDELVCACCLLPSDAVRRKALGDWLAENGDEELGAVVAGDEGETLVRATREMADGLQTLPGVRLMFAAWVAARLGLAEKEEPAPIPPPRRDEEPWRRDRNPRWPRPDGIWWETVHG